MTTARLIAAVWVHHDTDLLDVTVRAHGIDSVVDTTAHHPFWDQTRHAWTQAGQLTPGDGLLTDTGSTVTVISTKIVPGAADMWDLTVTTDHDFYIAEGTNAVLVHNCGPEGAAEAHVPDPEPVVKANGDPDRSGPRLCELPRHRR